MPNSTVSGPPGQSKVIVITPSPWFGKSAAIVAVYAPLPAGLSVKAPERTGWPSSTIWYVAAAPGQPSVTSASGSVQYAIGRPSFGRADVRDRRAVGRRRRQVGELE